MLNWIKKFTPWEWTIFLGVFIIFVINTLYFAYPDEFVNLLGGQAILHGKLPYKDFFDHHLPFAWYLSSILLALSFQSFVAFRILWATLVFIGLFILALWFRKHDKGLYPYYLVFMILYPILGVYFWFHLFLADSLAVFFFSLIFWLLLSQSHTLLIRKKVIFLTSFLTFCLIFSSLTYLYLAFVLYMWQLYLLRKNKKDILQFLGISAGPYLLYFLFLLLSGTLKEFYIANFYYNTKLYISIPNYKAGHFFNPLKFGLTLIFNFFDNYIPLLSKIKYFDLYFPIGTLAGLGTLSLLVLLATRNIFIAILFFLLLSFSAPRSNINQSNEMDYQGSLFLVLGSISALFSLYYFRITEYKNIIFDDLKRIVQLILLIFFIFSFIFLLNNTYSKFFQRYTQKMPSITNRSDTALFIDGILNKGDYYWIGPYEPDQEFFVRKAKLPGPFISLLPQFREDEYFRNSFIKQFETNPPKIIIYRHTASIFMNPAMEFGKFFVDWMNGKYTSVEHIPNVSVIGSPASFNIASDLYIRNDAKGEILQKLREINYIH